jgi:DNA repair exonuclease SbcCD nuclease subunit
LYQSLSADQEGLEREGDLFEKRGKLDVELFNLVYQIFAEKKTRKVFKDIIMLPGNHDLATKETDTLRSSIFAFNELPHVTVIKEPQTIGHLTEFNSKNIEDADRVYLHFVPFYDDQAQHITALKDIQSSTKKDGFHILCTHAELRGGRMGVTKSKKGISAKQMGVKNFDLILLGHFHQHQTIAGKIVYVGAPLQHKFSDVGERRGFILLNEKKKTWRHVPLKGLPKFKLTDNLKAAIKNDSKHFVRYTPKNEKDYRKAMQLLQDGKARFQLMTAASEQVLNMEDLGKGGLSTEALIERWVKDHAKSKQRKRLIKSGLKYLQGG